MDILSSLFGLNPKEKEKSVVVKVPTKPVVEPTIKESLANLAIEVIGAAKNTSLVPLDEDNLSSEYNKLVNLGLKNSANAKIIKRQLDNINYHNKAIITAEKLLKYMKVINELLGDSVILVSTSAFYELCHKYNLSIGRLQDYTGVVPAANLEELARIKYELSNKYYKLRINENIWRVTGVHNYSGYSNELIQKSLDATFSIFKVDIGWEIKDFFKNQSWADRVVFDRTCVDKNCFFIACPKSNLQEKTVIVSHAVDPIIFQYCPYGILVYTMWGEEAEDKVFEEYKKLNNLV